MPPVVKMSYFFSIEVSDLRQVSPLFKTHFLEQLQACFITFQDYCKKVPDLPRGTGFNRMLD